jgi:hypothetical protein
MFISAPDQVTVVRLTADKPGSINGEVTFQSPHKTATLADRGSNGLVFAGTGGKHGDNPGKIQFQADIRVINEGGAMTVAEKAIKIENADAVTVLVSCGTNFVNYKDLSADPAMRADGDLDAAAKTSYADLKSRNIADHQRLFRRVTIADEEDVHTGRSERVVIGISCARPRRSAIFGSTMVSSPLTSVAWLFATSNAPVTRTARAKRPNSRSTR